jgi:adenylate kinase family enzyme
LNRILLIGSAGSGKSTLAQKLGEILSLPVIHLDKFYWNPDWVPTPNEEWDKRIQEFTIQPQWIMDGNYSRTLKLRSERADLIIFLDMPRYLCIYRIIKRRIQYHGKTRADLNEQCPEKLDWIFFNWVWNFKKRSRPRILEHLKEVKDEKEVLIIKSRKEVKELISRMSNTSKVF